MDISDISKPNSPFIFMEGVENDQDCCDTATPMEGLYTCGASNYPGGLVLGGPGYIGATKVAEDLGANKWWKPTQAMDKYIKTYLED